VPLSLLDAELMLVMGFPPFRISSWARPRSPEPVMRCLPTSEDVLPLISGEPDTRMDQLKQWIVNLDHRSKNETLETGTSKRYGKLLDDFFYVLDELSEGLTIQRGRVNPDTLEVTVITDDGELPIEAVSQGMTSMISWVGILLQRLYEIYSDDDDPKQHYALVLIDEIDAHLHPSWQQTLVSKLSHLFPNVQFVATTHSPLVIAAMPAHQIFRFIRNAQGKVVQLDVEADMSMGRADQILTSDLFGLDTTLGTSTQERLERYQELLQKSSHTAEEKAEVEKLERELPLRVPLKGETTAKDIQESSLLEAAVMRQVADKIKHQYPKSSQSMLQWSDQILSNAEDEILP
jgi:phage terminase small subunit